MIVISKCILIKQQSFSMKASAKFDPRDFDFAGHHLNMLHVCTVKPVLRGHSKIDKIKILMTNGSLIKVESIAECSP